MELDFRTELTNLINQHSLENESNTPDWILAMYLTNCLAAYDEATNRRDSWWEHKHWEKPKLDEGG